jgi:hypothetical protein
MESAPGAGSTYGSCTEEGESCRRVAMVDDGARARKSDACNWRCITSGGPELTGRGTTHPWLIYRDDGVILADVILK